MFPVQTDRHGEPRQDNQNRHCCFTNPPQYRTTTVKFPSPGQAPGSIHSPKSHIGSETRWLLCGWRINGMIANTNCHAILSPPPPQFPSSIIIMLCKCFVPVRSHPSPNQDHFKPLPPHTTTQSIIRNICTQRRLSPTSIS